MSPGKSATQGTSDKAERGEISEVAQQSFLGFKIKPRPAGFAEGKEIPQNHVNFFSWVLFSWLTPLLRVGVSRPFEIDDFWELTDEFKATRLAIELEKYFYGRVPPSRRPQHLRPSSTGPATKRDVTDKKPTGMELKDVESGEGVDVEDELTGKQVKLGKTGKTSKRKKTDDDDEKERTHPEKIEEDGKIYDQNLLLAIHRTVMWRFWTGGMLGVCWIALTSTSPLVSRMILNYITESYEYSHRETGETVSVPKSVGYGIGISFALYLMQQVSSLFMNMFLQRGLITGFMLRAAVISVVSRKSVRLSGEARMVHTNGKLVTHISSDASFMDYAALLTHELYLQPAQVIVGLIILLHTIGYSALVGFAVLVIGIPFQAWLFSRMIGTRQRQMKIVDSRVRLLQEILSGIRVIKFMAYEEYFGSRISDYRQDEMEELKKNCLMRAIMSAVMAFIPVFAAVLSFITYSLSGHDLNAAIIFTALQSFNNIRQPLQLIPLAIQAVSDAYVGLGRVSLCLLGDEIDNPVPVYPDAEYAVSAHGSYSWESAEKPSDEPVRVTPGKGGPMGKGKPPKKSKKEKAAEKEERKRKRLERLNAPPVVPFALKDIDLDIPRGSFVVVCGRVGSGKSSLMQALLGEMKLVSGEAYLGGTSAYFPQSPWILNATLKENILFGSEMDDKRFDAAVKACALERDIAMLNHGIYTEIGEKGINISGGQKARVCLARAVYCGNEINFFDDPLSAVDAHVSKSLVDGLVNGPLRTKTRILITHHLEVLSKADLIITMVDGKIAEKGTYQELLATSGALAKLMAEHMSVAHDGSSETVTDPDLDIDSAGLIETQEDIELKKVAIEDELEKQTGEGRTNEGTADELAKSQAPGALVTMKEERAVGAVSSKVYTRYINSMGSVWWALAFMSCFILAQASIVGNTIFLGKWSDSSIVGWSQSDYMGLYAGVRVLSFFQLIVSSQIKVLISTSSSMVSTHSSVWHTLS
ncbi:Multidrug resistance-associated protein/mitoxantrone resistance protein, ABC superfamily [Phaffia rhodozyma]|uniref:Multidrug resistance-associated protein/mitoxantrone resistance protein, ABC superfamily n=1 Tax=Phaffia rhodozyma TaxID=264483 RepID=A0A0F7SFC7_PHARH|nr:Multidrug resistance-associated protein/mitoxantrone resistance protein, ABC superfamily [Phaffia rhodozyma]